MEDDDSCVLLTPLLASSPLDPMTSQASPNHPLELLAPAGDWSALEAALEAGTNAVYLGLTTLNARRRAKNFSQDEFVQAVEKIHAHGARAYLTLNIDLAEREVGQAARILELARECRVDAVLVRDPALLALHPHFPELEFHFSTQTCMANSADVAAAGRLGARRVVLARELSLSEIAAASAVPGVETEVFVQGALCFCISGRCLLSSWSGGRSGNRGSCTSPCRVPWSVEDQPAGTPLSMRDLSLLHRLDALRRAGVTALKIEGRLKTAAWVKKAVSLYRRALSGENLEPLLAEARELGAYTGRVFTSGYLDGQRDELTGEAAREAASTTESDTKPSASEETPAETAPTYDLDVLIEPRGIVFRCRCGGTETEWTVPKTVVRRKHKAVSVGQLLAYLSDVPIKGHLLGQGAANDFDFLMVPRAVNALVDRIWSVIRQSQKTPPEQVRVELPSAVRDQLAETQPSAANRLKLGDRPNRVRLEARALATFVKQVRPGAVIVDGAKADGLDRLKALCAEKRVPLIVALPQVFFEHDLTAISELVRRCVDADLTVEVNSWGGWHLAKAAGARMEAGPGFPVLNTLAARMLAKCGMESVTLSVEADRRQLEEITAQCPVPCSLVVFGRPALMTSRVRLPEDYLDKILADRRGVQVIAHQERGLTVFRPVEPFDLRGTTNEAIRVRHLVVDLVGSDDPLAEWRNVPLEDDKPLRFNYDRLLG